jgi:hypothetical protein
MKLPAPPMPMAIVIDMARSSMLPSMASMAILLPMEAYSKLSISLRECDGFFCVSILRQLNARVPLDRKENPFLWSPAKKWRNALTSARMLLRFNSHFSTERLTRLRSYSFRLLDSRQCRELSVWHRIYANRLARAQLHNRHCRKYGLVCHDILNLSSGGDSYKGATALFL